MQYLSTVFVGLLFVTIASAQEVQEDSSKVYAGPAMISRDLTEEEEPEEQFEYEVLASVGYGVVFFDENVSSPGDNIGPGVAHYGLEFRYGLFPNLTIGGELKYSPFRYELYQVETEPLAHFNHVVTASPLVHFRTSSNLNSESLIFYSGIAFSHVRLYAATLTYTNQYDSTVTEIPVPDVSGLRVGIPFGFGFETAPTIANRVRIRFYFGYQLPLGRQKLAFAAFPGSLGFGFSW